MQFFKFSLITFFLFEKYINAKRNVTELAEVLRESTNIDWQIIQISNTDSERTVLNTATELGVVSKIQLKYIDANAKKK